jgi:hypothetical protein
VAHITRGADTAFEKPSLVIEAMRVEVAVRAAKPHREEPALARMHHRLQQRRAFLVRHAAVPGKKQLFRNLRHALDGLDVELEAHAPLADARQARDHADDIEVAAFELARKPVRHAQMRAKRRPQKSGGERCR